MRTSKEIRRYLKQQHWYKEYVRIAKSVGIKYYYQSLLRGYRGEDTVSHTFFWFEYPEGYDIWSHRDELFVNWYNRGKKRYEGNKIKRNK